MAVIENDIQYNWVRKRVSKLKEKVDENTPTNNPYRIELELLSKLEKEYSEERATDIEHAIEYFARKQINVYEGLDAILEKIKTVALTTAIGKSEAWVRQKLTKRDVRGFIQGFKDVDIELVNVGLQTISKEISQSMIKFDDNRERVIEQVKVLSNYINMPYIYNEVLGKGAYWYKPRMLARVPGRKVCVFKEDDIHAINKAAMQIANELKSTELIL